MKNTEKASAKIRLGSALLLGPIIIFLLFLFSGTSSILADPPPEQNFDINLEVRGYEPISGYLGLIPFNHDIDPSAPQLSTLIEGNCAPAVTSLYQVYEWISNTRDGPYPRPADLPGNFDFATLVGFGAQSGQAILTPKSGYDIGGGYAAVVIFADSNSVTLKYTPDDNVAVGYTIHLQNLQVDPALIDCYNELNQAGREELPALWAGEKVGVASGGEVLVAIRDTGSFMDPRWQYDWWQGCDVATGREFSCKPISIFGPIPPSSPPPAPSPVNMCSATACNPASLSFSRVSRPNPCEACCQTGKLAYSCADTFSVVDSVSYSDPCDCNIACEGDCYIKEGWGGTVTINMCDTTAPFVGKSGQEDEEKYLSDYFDGTGFYYTPPYDLTKLGEVIRTFLEGGVWRKLAPEQYQDELKREMIQRAIDSLAGTIDSEKRIHNYIVEYRDEWKYLADIAPKPEDPEALKAWKRTIDYRLWPAVPMFSREDTLGYLTPWAGLNPEDYFSAQGIPTPLEVPHLARLFETTQKINEILIPIINQVSSLVEKEPKTKALLASTEENVLGENTYLAQKHHYSMKITPEITHQGGSSYSVCWSFYAQADCGLYDLSGNLSVSVNGGIVYSKFWGTVPVAFSYHCTYEPFNGPVSVTANPGDTITICADVTSLNHHCGEDPRPFLSGCISCTINPDGSTTCGGTPPAPTCCLPEPAAVSQCDRSGIEDADPNDTLCGPPLTAELRAVDCFECSDCPGASPSACRDVTQTVSRDIQVNLELPFLEEIWQYSTDILGASFFNIFRANKYPEFEDLDAKSQIKYEYDSGAAAPSIGNFYFPHLGGIQKAKEWVIATINSAYGTQ